MFQIREIVVQKIISDITQNGESKRIKLHEITKEKKMKNQHFLKLVFHILEHDALQRSGLATF